MLLLFPLLPLRWLSLLLSLGVSRCRVVPSDEGKAEFVMRVLHSMFRRYIAELDQVNSSCDISMSLTSGTDGAKVRV